MNKSGRLDGCLDQTTATCDIAIVGHHRQHRLKHTGCSAPFRSGELCPWQAGGELERQPPILVIPFGKMLDRDDRRCRGSEAKLPKLRGMRSSASNAGGKLCGRPSTTIVRFGAVGGVGENPDGWPFGELVFGPVAVACPLTFDEGSPMVDI